MISDRTLLEDYARTGAEAAFRELTVRYVKLVYSTAVRLLAGDTHRAEDVVQTVFIDLARLSRTISPQVLLGGWLHRRTCHVAANLLRADRRRQNRERQAAQMSTLDDSNEQNFARIAPVLDEAINHLNASDRVAILLRYFEERDLRTIGQALGTTDDAAQKRVSRALEKLRALLTRQGITASSAVLASVLSAQSATLVPLGLAATVSSAALAGASVGGGLTPVILKLAAMTKTKLAFGAAAAATLGTILVVELQTWTKLLREHEALQQHVRKLEELDAERGLSSNPLEPAAQQVPLNAQQIVELENLRREVAAWDQHRTELAILRSENGRLRTASIGGEATDPVEAEFAQETSHRMQTIKKWGLMFRVYAGDNGDQFPGSWDQVAEQIPQRERASFINFARENFEIAYRGKDQTTANHPSGILFREKQARHSPTGKWVKVYGFMDGSASSRSEPGVNFEAFENQFIMAPK